MTCSQIIIDNPIIVNNTIIVDSILYQDYHCSLCIEDKILLCMNCGHYVCNECLNKMEIYLISSPYCFQCLSPVEIIIKNEKYNKLPNCFDTLYYYIVNIYNRIKLFVSEK